MSRSKKVSPSDIKSITRQLVQFGEQLYTLSRLEINTKLAKHDLKYSQWLILSCIHREEVITPSKVASKLGMERATVSRNLDFLESRNLLKRTHNLTDRRVVEIEITAAGRKMVQAGAQRLEQIFADVLNSSTNQECNQFVTLLDRIGDELHGRIGDLTRPGND